MNRNNFRKWAWLPALFVIWLVTGLIGTDDPAGAVFVSSVLVTATAALIALAAKAATRRANGAHS